MENILFVYNPESGKRKVVGMLDTLAKIFQKQDKFLTFYRISDDNASTVLDVIKNSSFDGIVVCGGDGTVNIIANLLLQNKIKIPFGIIPNGTCNDFARSLNLPTDQIACAEQIALGRSTTVDVGIVNNEHYFINELAGGVFVNVSFQTDSELKKAFGPLAYYMTGIGELGNIKPFKLKITTDDNYYEVDALVFLILNGPDVSGFSNVIREAKMRDGYMDILVFKKQNIFNIADSLAKIMSSSELNEDNVLKIKTKYCKIECDSKVVTTIDGEKGVSLPLEAKMIDRALSVYY